MEIKLQDTVKTTNETVLVEKHVYEDKPGQCPCESDDKACHQRWFQAFSDCDQ